MRTKTLFTDFCPPPPHNKVTGYEGNFLVLHLWLEMNVIQQTSKRNSNKETLRTVKSFKTEKLNINLCSPDYTMENVACNFILVLVLI